MTSPRPGSMPAGSYAGWILIAVGACAMVAACSSSPTTPAPSTTASSGPVGLSPAPSDPAPSNPAPSKPASSTPVPTSAASATGSTLTTLPGAATVLTGTIRAGVESGCIILVDDSGVVVANLIGLDASSTPTNSPVTVTGKFEADVMTTCQQGTPFVVAAVAPK